MEWSANRHHGPVQLRVSRNDSFIHTRTLEWQQDNSPASMHSLSLIAP
jgi:hypothetical protein